MRITFIGATHEVTGSCTLIEVGKYSYLVDYGMRQGRETYRYEDLPIRASQLDGVFLTHAHIDHSGLLPKLFRKGFKGAVYATDATVNLCDILLRDSAHIQENDAEWKNRKLVRSGNITIEPEYTINDALGVLQLFKGFRYGEHVILNDSIAFSFSDVGHLLGSAAIEFWLTEGCETKKIVFSGDVGNINHPIIRDPLPIDGCDYLVIESTYGSRLHTEEEHLDPTAELADIIKRAFGRGGNVIIPSFAVGRTQELLYILRGIKEKRLVEGFENFPVYLDSPLAVEATNVFINCDRSYFDEHMLNLIDRGINPLEIENLHFSVTSEESKAINFDKNSKVIISSSGMCDAGRIRHHLKHNLWNKSNIILFVGYQSEGSLGRIILDGKKTVKLFGEDVAVNAEICNMHGTSGHADRDGLLSWIACMSNKPKMIFVNHGSHESCEAFKDSLVSLGFHAIAPFSGTLFDPLSQAVKLKPAKLSEKESTRTRSDLLYNQLMQQVKELELVAKGLRGGRNSDLSRLTNQISQLLEKW